MTASNIVKKRMLDKIKANIDQYGYHVYLITEGECPRFAYTVGLSEKLGMEVVFAGGCYFSVDEVKMIIDGAAKELLKNNDAGVAGFESADFGRFDFKVVDPSWIELMLLAVFDFYKKKNVEAIQICPGQEFWTIDIPDMTLKWEDAGPVWRRLGSDRTTDSDVELKAATNMALLQGGSATEAARWEEDIWEIFSGDGSDVSEEDMRVVPLSLLLAVDPTLEEVANLEVGQARWREAGDAEWHVWE